MLEPLSSYTHNLLSGLLTSKSPGTLSYRQVAVHPCVINGERYIVYPRGLQQLNPDLFAQLSAHFRQRGYRLKEDQRNASASAKFRNERRKWVPALLFTASMLLEGTAIAETITEAHNHDAHQHYQVELHLVPNSPLGAQTDSSTHTDELSRETSLKNSLAGKLFQQLSAHYIKRDSDPEFILDDFRQIANYYSQFPEVIKLLKTLEKKNWQLQYDAKTWVTVASGNIFDVEKAVIHFNTRSAAQLRLNNGCKNNPVCIASPADALLHELLHTQSMLVNTDKFIAQGGMNNIMYPYKHEYSIIEAERVLYAKMSHHDAIKRPQRVDHTGRAVKTDCPTCI